MGEGMGERKGIAAPADGRTDALRFWLLRGAAGAAACGSSLASGRLHGWLGGVGGIGQIDIDLPRGMSGEQRPLRA